MGTYRSNPPMKSYGKLMVSRGVKTFFFFLFRVWLLVGCPCPRVETHIYLHMDSVGYNKYKRMLSRDGDVLGQAKRGHEEDDCEKESRGMVQSKHTVQSSQEINAFKLYVNTFLTKMQLCHSLFPFPLPIFLLTTFPMHPHFSCSNLWPPFL